MAYRIITTKRFEKNVKLCRKRGYPMSKLRKVLDLLIDNGSLPPEYKPHKLSGNLDNQWECHITSDWIMTWQQHDQELILLMLATGTHSDLFGKTRR